MLAYPVQYNVLTFSKKDFPLTYTLYTEILASKGFHTFSLSGKLAIFILATRVSLHKNLYENRVKLSPFKISYLR